MTFKYTVKVKDLKSVIRFEQLTNQKIPEPLLDILVKNNYGYPEKKTFNGDGYVFSMKCLLSLNEDDDENLFDFYKSSREISEELGFDFIPFAMDDYGNLICFIPDTYLVIFIDEETLDVYNTKLSLEEFFNSLT